MRCVRAMVWAFVLTAIGTGLCAGAVFPEPNAPPRILTGIAVFKKQIITNNVDETHAVVVADLDGDGDVDAVATDFVDGAVHWYENDGSLNFIPHDIDTNLVGAYPASVADVDLDGDVDVLATGYLADTIVWYENDGLGVFTRHDVDTNADGAHSVVAGDMDDDGDIDLLATNQDEGAVLWYENNGLLGFVRHTIDAGALMAKRAEFCDLDGDGDQDVVASSFGADEVAWYENDGNEVFTKRVITTNANGAYYTVAADLDGDGDEDVVGVSQLDNKIAWYENDGSGNFTAWDIDTEADGARTVQTVDMDNDGDVDVLAASVNDDTVGWYENDGLGNFTQHAVDLYALGAYGIGAAHMDNDGYIDVLSANRDSDTVALHRQIREHRAVLTDAGGVLPIRAPMLHTSDVDNIAAAITYTITSAPVAGELQVGGLVVPLGGSFTQEDINAEQLFYVWDGSPVPVDEFEFTVADRGKDGVTPAAGSFTIHIGESLCAHWPFDESTGGVAADMAGPNDGFLSSGPIWQSDGGIVGGALQFDGVDDRVELGGIDATDGEGLTLAMWVCPQVIGSDGRLISKASGVGEQDHFWMISTYGGTQLRLRLRTRGETSTLVAPQPVLAVGQWTHVVCTYDKREMRIYSDGQLLAHLPKAGSVDLDPLVNAAIGNQPLGAGNNPFAGMIDDVRIYQRALSAAEILDLMLGNEPSGVGEQPNRGGRRGGELLSNVPNPFNPTTSLRFVLTGETQVSLRVYDLGGRVVRTVVAAEVLAVGEHQRRWDGRDDVGRLMGSGVYLVRLEGAGEVRGRRIVLVR